MNCIKIGSYFGPLHENKKVYYEKKKDNPFLRNSISVIFMMKNLNIC